MSEVLQIVVVVALVAILVIAIVALLRLNALARERDTVSRDAAEIRARIDALLQSSAGHERDVRGDLVTARSEQGEAAVALRREVAERLDQFAQRTQQSLRDSALLQAGQAQAAADRLQELTLTIDRKLEAIRSGVEQRLDRLRTENAEKLEQMRVTVDEKLHATLETRLGASFKQVSDRLEQVHKGLGEMQTLAVGVGDLKRVLTNVKSRGTWGEVQLGALLAEVLTPVQFAANVETVRGSNRRVEFAIRLPGRDPTAPVWLPVDAKFPLDDWQRLQDALERADPVAADLSRRSLADFIRLQAKTIRDHYVSPPQTTDFAILFVPVESLFAEMMARPGFSEQLQRDYRVTLSGPANFLALLNSLQMGFRTLAIEERSSEVWQMLRAVKTEFGKFGDVLVKTKDRIDKAGAELEKAGVRSRAISRELRKVDAMPEPEATRLLDLDAGALPDLSAPAERTDEK